MLVLLAAFLAGTLVAVVGGWVASRKLGKALAMLAAPATGDSPPSAIVEIANLRRLLDATTARYQQAEAAFHDREFKLAAIIGYSPAVLSLKEPDGRYNLANPNLQKIHHCSEAELIGKTDFELYPEAVARSFRANDELVLRTMMRQSVEEVVPVDGQQRTFMSHMFPVVDASGAARFICRISLDITDRKRAEAAAYRNEMRYRTLVDQCADALFVHDHDGRLVEVSQRACDSVGYTRTELLAMNVVDLELDLDLPSLRAAWSAIAPGSVYTLLGRHRRRDGTVFPVEVRFGVLILDDQRVYIAIVRDITERLSAEQEIRDGKATLEAALASMSDAVFISDTEGRFLHFNEAFATFHKFKIKEECAKTFAEYPAFLEVSTTDGQLLPVAQWAVPRALRGETMVSAEFALRRRDTGEAWIGSYNFAPIRNKDGMIVGSVVTGRDVTQAKQAEQDLKQLNQHLEAMVEQRTREVVDLYDRAPCGYHSLAADGTITRANRTELELLGYSREDFVGHHVTEFMTEESKEQFQRLFPEFLRSGVLNNVEFNWLAKDGTTIPVLVSGNMIRDAEGNYLSSRSTLTDNRERKAHEQEIETARHAAEAATSAKSAFLANMSHEIRTPMNAIIGLTHLLRRASPTPQQSERLDKIDMAGRHLLSIINDILDISKIEAGRIQLEATDFHLSAILDHVASLIAEQAQAKGLTVDIDPDHVPMWLRGDPTRLRQSLLNYASNAVKFTAQGSVTLRALLLEDNDGAMLVRFEVEDTGQGIAADKLPNLFQPFEQADASTTRKFGGTGLGLTITRRLAGLMGGEAGVTSTVGVGSTFWFTVRLDRGHGIMPISRDESKTDAEIKLRLRHGGARLLLADDNIINREVALELLHGIGLNVDIAVNGREAIEKVRGTAYSLVLMDVSMPEVNGLDAAKAIRLLPGREAMPILAMTANAFDEDRQACLDAGMDDFVPKPVDPDVLFAMVLKWLSQDGAASAVVSPSPPQPPATSDLLARLAALPGVDSVVGLRMLRGKSERYVELLRALIERHPAALDILDVCRASGDLEELQSLAHALKGASGTLGAVLLASRAADLEAAIRANMPNDEIDRLAADLDDAQAQLGAALRTTVT